MEPIQAVVYCDPKDVETGRVRGYVHPAAMGAGLMAVRGEKQDWKGETADQAALRLDGEGWVPLVAELRFIGYVRASTSVVTTIKDGSAASNGQRRDG